MQSKFWDSVRSKIKHIKDGQKWLAEKSGVGRTAINSGISRLSSPSVDNAYFIAQALGTTMEELVDGEIGAEYVRKVVRNDPKAIQVPDRIYGIVESLLLLDENELAGLRANAEVLARNKKGNPTITTETDNQEKATG